MAEIDNYDNTHPLGFDGKSATDGFLLCLNLVTVASEQRGIVDKILSLLSEMANGDLTLIGSPTELVNNIEGSLESNLSEENRENLRRNTSLLRLYQRYVATHVFIGVRQVEDRLIDWIKKASE